MQEHRVIEIVLSCLDRMADNCDAGRPLDMEAATQALDFLRVYADECHHHKEEDLLFPLMEAKGFQRQNGPTGVMLHEHELGRRRIRGMADAIKEFSLGDLAGKLLFVEHARAYSALLRQHIQKEDHCLFQMADQALSRADQEELAAAFDKVEAGHGQRGAQKKYVSIAYALADRLGVPVSDALGSAYCGCSGSGQHAGADGPSPCANA